MNRDNWKPLPAAEWKRRLNAVRAIALRRIARYGLDVVGSEEDIASMIAFHLGPVGPLLNPALAIEKATIDQIVGDEGSDELCAYTIQVAETAFLFGVITGCHLSWPVVEAMPAPSVPPKTKGGAR